MVDLHSQRTPNSIVDAHCHVGQSWYEPVEALLEHMDRTDVDHAILVQMRGQYDNAYQLECVARFPDRLVSVVAVDVNSMHAPSRLAELAALGAKGVRLWNEGRVLDAESFRMWKSAEELGLPVSCNGSRAAFASSDFAALLNQVSDVPVLIEHFGMSQKHDGNGETVAIRRQMMDLARFPHVYMKIGGLGEIARRAYPVDGGFPFEEPIPPVLEYALEAFGARRLVWGSNYPPVSGLEGYGNSLRFPMERLFALSSSERGLIFGGTARLIYRIPDSIGEA